MARRKYHRSDDLFSGINITPFTDIVLVLLIIFMITAPGLLYSGLDLNLPGSSSSLSLSGEKLAVGLDGKGQLYFEGKRVSGDELKKIVIMKIALNREFRVILNADSASSHGRVIEVLDLLRSTGAQHVYVGAVKK